MNLPRGLYGKAGSIPVGCPGKAGERRAVVEAQSGVGLCIKPRVPHQDSGWREKTNIREVGRSWNLAPGVWGMMPRGKCQSEVGGLRLGNRNAS